jgi:hypothetical protein
MNKPSVADSPEKPTCWVRRHLSPSLFMTYDAMRGMAKKDAHGELICYGKLITIANHTSLSKNQNADNILALDAKGWVMPQNRERWNKGRWGYNSYIILEHADYEKFALQHQEPYVMCPPFKYDSKTGENLIPMTDEERRKFERSDFAINAVLKRHAGTPEWRARTAALQSLMDAATPEEKAEWFRPRYEDEE